MKNKDWAVFFSIISVVMGLCIVAFVMSNTTSLKEGKIYYTDKFNAYCYDIKSKVNDKIKIKGYRNVNFYLPVDDGYIAVVDNNKDDTDELDDILLYNDEVLISKEFIYDVSLVGNYIFYCTGDLHLYAFNLQTQKEYKIIEYNRLGYSHAGNYVYYSERDEDSFYDDTEIYAIDCTADEIKPIVVDIGIICRNTDNALIYTKGGRYYHYDFERMEPVKTDPEILKNDKYRKKYLGSISVDKTSFVIHLLKPKMYDPVYNDDTEYIYRTLRGEYYGVIDDFRGCIKISGSDGSLYIPTSKSNAVTVEAIECNNKIYYPHKACTYDVDYY